MWPQWRFHLAKYVGRLPSNVTPSPHTHHRTPPPPPLVPDWLNYVSFLHKTQLLYARGCKCTALYLLNRVRWAFLLLLVSRICENRITFAWYFCDVFCCLSKNCVELCQNGNLFGATTSSFGLYHHSCVLNVFLLGWFTYFHFGPPFAHVFLCCAEFRISETSAQFSLNINFLANNKAVDTLGGERFETS